MAFKNIIITGAAGSLGKVVLERLVASNNFNITILRRAGSTSTFPHNLPVVDADFESVDSLTSALKGQDAVIATLGSSGLASQIQLIDASIAAGVKRIIPSEFGSDISQPTSRGLPVFAGKVKVAEYLEEKAKEGKITYTAVYNNAFLDWGLDVGFIVGKKGKTFVIDGGNYTFSTTLLSTVGDGVVGILTHPEETANREVRIESTKVTQQKLLQIAKELAPETDWTPEDRKLDDLIAKSNERLANHQYDFETFVNYLYKACLHPDGKPNFVNTDNALLGLKTLSDEELKEVVKKHFV